MASDWQNQLDELRAVVTSLAATVAAIDARVVALVDDLQEYMMSHAEWCTTLSETIGGAATVLGKFERYRRPENATPKYAEASSEEPAEESPEERDAL